ncbi:hypothetical protein JCM10207_003881 [Rhodosporidiobolus poonsookiae]
MSGTIYSTVTLSPLPYAVDCFNQLLPVLRRTGGRAGVSGLGGTMRLALLVDQVPEAEELVESTELYEMTVHLYHPTSPSHDLLDELHDLLCESFVAEENGQPHRIQLHWTPWHRAHCSFTFAGGRNLNLNQDWVIAPGCIFYLVDGILEVFHQHDIRAFTGPAIELLLFFFLHNTHPSTLPPEQQAVWQSLRFADLPGFFEERCAANPQLAIRARNIFTLSAAQALANFLVSPLDGQVPSGQLQALHAKRLDQACRMFVWVLGLLGVSAPKELKPRKESVPPVVIRVGRRNSSARAA